MIKDIEGTNIFIHAKGDQIFCVTKSKSLFHSLVFGGPTTGVSRKCHGNMCSSVCWNFGRGPQDTTDDVSDTRTHTKWWNFQLEKNELGEETYPTNQTYPTYRTWRSSESHRLNSANFGDRWSFPWGFGGRIYFLLGRKKTTVYFQELRWIHNGVHHKDLVAWENKP